MPHYNQARPPTAASPWWASQMKKPEPWAEVRAFGAGPAQVVCLEEAGSPSDTPIPTQGTGGGRWDPVLLCSLPH